MKKDTHTHAVFKDQDKMSLRLKSAQFPSWMRDDQKIGVVAICVASRDTKFVERIVSAVEALEHWGAGLGPL